VWGGGIQVIFALIFPIVLLGHEQRREKDERVVGVFFMQMFFSASPGETAEVSPVQAFSYCVRSYQGR